MSVLPDPNAPRILVAERDPDRMDQLATLLEDRGYVVHKAYYAGDALDALRHQAFDLAVIDTQMVDRGQHPLANQMVEFNKVAWVAVVDERHAAPQSFLARGAAAIVQRPFTAGVLLRHLENTLRGQRMSLAGQPELPDEGSRTAHDELSRLLAQRLTEQQTLSRLARSLSAVLDLDVLLTQVVDAAVSLSHAEEGLLLLPDEEDQALLIRAAKGLDGETARNFRIKTQDSLAGHVYRTGQPVLVGDRGPQKIKTEYLVKSLLYVPLSIKGQIIGVLGVNNKYADRTFSQHSLDLLQDLAAHAAVAIENARLYEDSLLRTRELATLVEAGEAANSTLALDKVLATIAAKLIAALGASQCYIGEWMPDEQALRLLAVQYRALWRPAAGPGIGPTLELALDRGLSLQRPVLTALTAHEGGAYATTLLPQRYAAASAITTPLLTHEGPLGAIVLTRMDEAFSENDAHKVQRELQQYARDLLNTLSGPDVRRHESALFAVAHHMIAAVNADWLEIALWNSSQQQMSVTLSCGGSIWLEETKPTLDLRDLPQLARALAAQTTISGPPQADIQALADLVSGQSVLALPLIIKGETAGLVLLVDTLSKRTFTRREVELAQALVLQAANALDNARLYRDLELSLHELHRTQSRLVQTARLSAMGELAAAVAHQVNNPLTTILGDTELILTDLPLDDPNRESLEAISRAGKRAHEVVRRLLAMARQRSGDESPEPQDINTTIRNTLTLVESHIRQGRIALEVDLDENLPMAAGIHGQLEDVWLNLLLNARDAVAGRPDPRISVKTRLSPDQTGVEIVVCDNGEGIAPELHALVFDPFFTTKPPGEGTGLGLHICQQIVSKSGGRISVQSNYNEGACFVVFLPSYRGADEP